jgi:hypothetical protein
MPTNHKTNVPMACTALLVQLEANDAALVIPPAQVEEAYIECGEAERDEYLYCILAKHPGRTLVFVNAISSVRRLGAILKLLGLPAHPLHAGEEGPGVLDFEMYILGFLQPGGHIQAAGPARPSCQVE